MTSVLRRRIPWGSSGSGVAEEGIPLIDSTAGSVVEGTEGIELAEFGTFATIEEAGAALDSTGIGAPIGITIGILAALGFGAYEIYEHLVKKDPTITHATVGQHFDKARANPQPHINAAKSLQSSLDIVPLEHQHQDADFISQENQHSGFVPPPFKYLGPGNSLNRGQPYNYIDDDARTHDIEYNQAKTIEDVYKSDQKFISAAGDHFIEGLSGKGSISDTIGAAIGGIGIGAKHLFEKSTGTIVYPSISGKQWHLLPGDSSNSIIEIGTLVSQTNNATGLIMIHNTNIYLQINHPQVELSERLKQIVAQLD